MGNPKKPKSIHQAFEGNNPRGQFAKITQDMMQSPAWRNLCLRQQGLYLYIKAKYKVKMINGNFESDNRDNLSLPKSEWYPDLYSDYRTFSKDIRKLEDNGFLKTIRYGKAMHQCNLYGLCEEWKRWKPQ